MVSTCASTAPSRGDCSSTSVGKSGRSKGNRKAKTQAANRNKVSVDPSSHTKDETTHLIKLRDEMISAKHEEASVSMSHYYCRSYYR